MNNLKQYKNVNHYPKRYIIYSWLKYFVILIMISIWCIGNIMEEDADVNLYFEKYFSYFIIGAIIFLVITLLISILRYNFVTFELTEDYIEFNQGVIFKQKVLVHYNKMHGVTKTQNIILQLFGLCKIAIDSGNASMGNKDEIIIYHTKEFCFELEKFISGKRTKETILDVKNIIETTDEKNESKKINETSNNIDYKYTFNKILKTVFFNIINLIVGLIGIGIIAISIISGVLNNDNLIIIGGSIGGILLYIGFIVISIATFYFKYYNYQIENKKEEISISFGLFNKKHLIINKSKIKSLKVKQDIIMKKYNLASIEIQLIGLNNINEDNDNSTINNLFIPLCKFDEVNKMISSYLDDYYLLHGKIKPREKTLLLFVEVPFIVFTTIFLFGSLFLLLINLEIYIILVLIVYILIMLFVLMLAILEKKNNSLVYDDNLLCVRNGSLVYTTTIVKWKNVIEIVKHETILREKKEVVKVNINYYNTQGSNFVTLEMFDKKIFEIINEKMIK